MPADTLHTYFPLAFGLVFFLAAALCASVGHGGASAYLAVMGLLGMAPTEMKPIALTLNIAVSLLAGIAFTRAGHFRPRLFWPLAVASVPAALLGAWLQSPEPVSKLILAAALIAGAWRLFCGCKADEATLRDPYQPARLLPAVLAGGWIGSHCGSSRAGSPTLLRVLAAVLVVAAAKFAIP